jgi:hypothetical protein
MFSPLIQYSMGAAAPRAARTGRGALHYVQAVGCLVRDRSETWLLTNGSEPVVSKTQSTSSSALRAAANIELGKQTYQLVGAGYFNPRRQESRRVAVKGVLIEDAGGNRLNVTSLQAVAGACL